MALTAIIKPLHDCNLRCGYCYTNPRAEKGRMNLETLDKTIKQVVENSDGRSTFVWHGGECLLMGLDFFKKAYEIQQSYTSSTEITNTIQTNGTLVNTELLEFISKTKDFYLGFSLDGPKEISNLTRKFYGGRGAFEEIFRGIKLARDFNGHVGSGAIVVVNRMNLNHLDEIYNFFNKERINIKLNHIISCDDPIYGISPLEYGIAMKKLFDRWIDDSQAIDIDPFSQFLGNLMTGKATCCSYLESCRNNFISIGPKGDIYPCARFDGLSEFWMGNIHQEGLKDALNSEVQKKLKKRSKNTLQDCLTCDYSSVCNGGCMHNALLGGDIMGKDPFCPGYKILYSHIDKRLHKELSKLELKNE